MKFLIDGHRNRVAFREQQWPDGVGGQLLTPLTRYRTVSGKFAIDNGCFTSFKETNFKGLLKRELINKDRCLFVCVPDKVGSHIETQILWNQYNYLVDGWPKAFVAQEGYDGYPAEATTLFIGGTDKFKNSEEAMDAVLDAKSAGLHVHIGRVNSAERFIKFYVLGADTCDGSGISRYDHMLPALRDIVLNAL